ncbi:hypothetical protein BSL78_07470 [Apostichopus japonicus]|uniref:Uncharacterized protein n=1 Tax=Stichopus japonicus TaxID=307972 RepID=A0A2G8L5U8_STIJA|nr:hypothetical protein BSL78_07470 [Apostichopus japonicus]
METGNQFASETNLSIIISSDNSSAVPVTAGGAVQELQSALQSISNQAGLQCAERLFPKLFYTSSVEEATQVIDSYEMKTNSKFIVYKESKFFGQNEPLHVMACQKRGLDGAKNKVVHRIVWEDRETSLAQYEPIPYDGVPYMQLGRKIYDCHLGVLREKPKRNSSKRPRKPQKSRKVGCTARISLREIHKFPEFQIVKGQESDYYRSLKSKEIRRAILKQKAIGDGRIYVSLPHLGS